MPNPFVLRIYKVDGHDVECRFFTPEQDRDDYRCQYEIALPNRLIVSQGYGVDQIQALLLSMQKAHVEQLVMRDKSGKRVEWLEQENLGLPINDALRDLAPKNDF